MIKFRLKVLAAERDMSQTDIVLKTGIRQPTISAIYNNTMKRIPIEVLDKLCKVMECELCDIIKYIPDDK